MNYNWKQALTPEGVLTEYGEGIWFKLASEQKQAFYKWMRLIRMFDERCVSLQRQGRIGTYAPLAGQEAAQVGSAFALSQEDWVFPSYRDHGATIVLGMPIAQVLLYWMGRVEGCKPPIGTRLMPPTVPISTQLPHAVGAAWAAKLKQENFVAIAYFGDGATSEGDFHEACNFAGVFQVPVIFFCQNNGYAISVPFSRQSATPSVYEKATAYSMASVQVDGNDVLAVYEVTRQARAQKQPILIEAITYRRGAHTTADDPTRYRPQEEVDLWIPERDPVARYQSLLLREELWNEHLEQQWLQTCQTRIEEAIHHAESLEPSVPNQLFTHLYAELPVSLQRQQTELGEGI